MTSSTLARPRPPKLNLYLNPFSDWRALSDFNGFAITNALHFLNLYNSPKRSRTPFPSPNSHKKPRALSLDDGFASLGCHFRPMGKEFEDEQTVNDHIDVENTANRPDTDAVIHNNVFVAPSFQLTDLVLSPLNVSFTHQSLSPPPLSISTYSTPSTVTPYKSSPDIMSDGIQGQPNHSFAFYERNQLQTLVEATEVFEASQLHSQFSHSHSPTAYRSNRRLTLANKRSAKRPRDPFYQHSEVQSYEKVKRFESGSASALDLMVNQAFAQAQQIDTSVVQPPVKRKRGRPRKHPLCVQQMR